MSDSKFITKVEAKEYLKQVGYQLHTTNWTTGRGVTSYFCEIVMFYKDTDGNNKYKNIGRITKSTYDSLYSICDKHKCDINKASGTGDGWYAWVSVEKRSEIK